MNAHRASANAIVKKGCADTKLDTKRFVCLAMQEGDDLDDDFGELEDQLEDDGQWGSADDNLADLEEEEVQRDIVTASVSWGEVALEIARCVAWFSNTA